MDFSQLIIRDAFAAEEAKGSILSNLPNIMPLMLIMAVFYFLVIRPQQKRTREHQRRISQLARGDEIITSGGIVGTVVNVPAEGDHVTVEIAKDVKIKVAKHYVSEFLSQTRTSNDKPNDKKHSRKNLEKEKAQ